MLWPGQTIRLLCGYEKRVMTLIVVMGSTHYDGQRSAVVLARIVKRKA